MARITHIMDMDGFELSSGFLCKELAIIDVHDGSNVLAEFRLGKTINNLSADDRRTVEYTTNCVHGIPFTDFGFESYNQGDIKSVIRNFVSDCSNPVVAYKGGHFELDILRQMRINSYNLENMECPTYDNLIKNPKYRTFDKPCRLHCQTSLRTHCCLNEVKTFRLWYINEKGRF
ncbi:uncharacterized protein LOC143354001 [Halictus rubicundus]|uniref:uncharacterized protein LOC143354001 n=1 Tax=Halictus rubicundus TaxID=77578 RepID=UPI0040369E09